MGVCHGVEAEVLWKGTWNQLAPHHHRSGPLPPRAGVSASARVTCLLIAIRPLLLGRGSRLRCSVAPVLLALSLLVAGVLRGGALGRP